MKEGSSSWNLKSPQQQVQGKDEDRYRNLTRPDAGHARLAPVRRQRHRHAGVAVQVRRLGRERRDGRRGRPSVRRRSEQPRRLLRAQPRHLRQHAAGAHPEAALRQHLPWGRARALLVHRQCPCGRRGRDVRHRHERPQYLFQLWRIKRVSFDRGSCWQDPGGL